MAVCTKHQFIVWFLWLFAFVQLWANNASYAFTLNTTESSVKMDLTPYLTYFEDKTGVLSFEQIKQHYRNKHFIPSQQMNFGYRQSAFWLHFQWHNTSQSRQSWLLEIAHPWYNQLDLYIDNGLATQTIHKTAGITHSFANREHAYPYFLFNIDSLAGQRQDIYLRIKSDYSLIIPMTLWKVRHFEKHQYDEIILQGIFYGAVIFATLYNFFIYLSLKEISYLYYVIYIIFSNLYIFCLNGLGYAFFWPDSPEWNQYALTFFLTLALPFCNRFSQTFLDTAKYTPIIHGVYHAISLLSFVLLMLIPFISVSMGLQLITFIGIIWVVCNIITPILCLQRGQKLAKYFLLAWVIFLINCLFFAMMTLGVLPRTLFTQYGIQIGIICEVFLLSFALAHRIKLLQIEKEHAQTEALIASKTKTRFLLNMGHELRTPLTHVIGYAEMIKEDAEEENLNTMADDANKIRQAGLNLLSMINFVMEFSDYNEHTADITSELHIAPISLKDLHQKIKSYLNDTMQKSHCNRVSITTPSPELILHTDHKKLVLILSNLLNNACKFSSQTPVLMTTTLEPNRHHPKCIRFMIKDSGIGIKEDFHNKIFEPFFQIDDSSTRQQDGTGLGLSISQYYAKLLNGKIHLESTVGEGSIFSLILPYHSSVRKK